MYKQESRKKIRKNKRKEKKQKRFEYYVNRNKAGKYVLNKNEDNIQLKPKNKKSKKEKPNTADLNEKLIITEKRQEEKLQKEMAKQRKKQLLSSNEDEDRHIKQLEKQLKLNKRKSKTIPKSFTVDGLDYLLEVCDPENMKSVATAEQHYSNFNDFEDDFALITNNDDKKPKKKIVKDTKSDLSVDDDNEEFNELNSDEQSLEDENLDSFGANDYLDDEISDDFEANDQFSDDETSENFEFSENENSDNEFPNSKKRKCSTDKNLINEQSTDVSFNEDFDLDDEENTFSNKDSDTDDEEQGNNKTWEDIYGRLRTKDGEVISETKGKYIPPALRNVNTSDNAKDKEKLSKLRKQLKGLLNRLTENNMHSIGTQVEQMYMSNSRNNMNEVLTQLIFEALITPVFAPERLLLENVLLVTILHANIGTEVGAQFLQRIVQKFDDLFNKDQSVENKELDNTISIIAQLYNFKLFQSQLLYQLLARLCEKFEEKHVECILLILKNVGFSLRKDDPLALKQLILDLQKKAANTSKDNIRVKFMLDILLAIKNNNVTKIPNYDTTYSEHLKKLSKNFIRKGNYVTQLNISLDDLLKAEEKGRWWIVGSAWSGNDRKQEQDQNTQKESYDKKLWDLARKQRMNTDTRRSIFCVLMTAENYTDAFEKLLNLGLKNQQEREIIYVLLHCSLQEKQYNPYYSLLAQKFCLHDRKYQIMIRCCIWDKLKSLMNCSGKQISILAKLMTYLFINQGLPISVLKVIEFGDLDQVTLRLIRQVLIAIFLNSNEEKCVAVFSKISLSPKLKMFRDSLILFIHHFILKNLNKSDLSEENKNLLTSRAKLVEKYLAVFESKSTFY